MEKFPLNRVPYSLKTQIFSCLEPEDSLKFLQISSELRHFLLNHGPFPKKIEQLWIESTNSLNSEESLYTEALRIQLDTEEDRFFFRVENPREHDKTIDHIPLKATDFRLFRNLAACQKITINTTMADREADFCVAVHDFLPNCKFLEELTIFGSQLDEIDPIFASFTAKIELEFYFFLEKQELIPDTRAFERFFREKLETCPRIDLTHTRLEVASLCLRDFRLQSTKLRELEISSANGADFRDFTEHLLSEGTRIPETLVRWREPRGEEASFADHTQHLIDRLKNYEKIEDPEAQKRIFERFAKNTAAVQPFCERITYFRRRIPREPEISNIFMTVQVDDEFRFYVGVEFI